MSADMIGAIKFDERGLVPAVVQEGGTGMVLMVAWMNAESVRLSLETGYTHFWSRSRGKLWKKGESSGHLQKIREMRYDCDADCLLVSVDQTGPACHTGQKSCFHRDLATGHELAPPAVTAGIFQALEELIADRRANPREGSYVNYLLGAGEERVRAKFLEESRETAEASRQGDRGQLAYEAADLLFHLLVLLAANGLKLEDAARELAGRFGKPHKKEKNQRADR